VEWICLLLFGKNHRAPEEEGLKGKVYVTFVVEKDGSHQILKI
jgi:protein TonB